MRSRTALVTGAAGFIGSHVCDRLLPDGWRVVGVDDLSAGRAGNLSNASGDARFSLEEADLRAPEAAALVERVHPEVVFHLAAQAGVRPSLDDPRDDAERNVVASVSLFAAAAAAGTAKVVYAASGGTIYGEPEAVPVREEAARASRPVSPYGISKKAAGDYLEWFAGARGLDYVSLALANVYGPRQDPHGEAGVVAIFGAAMLRGESPAIFGDGEQTRDFVYVADVAEAFAAAAERGSRALVNIGTGSETSVNSLYEALAGVIGFDGAPGRGPLPPGDVRRIALDVSLARRVLGWRPATSLDDGLRATVEWLRAQPR